MKVDVEFILCVVGAWARVRGNTSSRITLTLTLTLIPTLTLILTLTLTLTLTSQM